jgi:polyhydroxyalkanoate synthesis regulator phasin
MLTREDKQWITDLIKGVESNLHQEIKGVESNLREEILANRQEIKSLKTDIQELRKELQDVNENRTEDSDVAFSEIAKYVDRIEKLEARVIQLEKKMV